MIALERPTERDLAWFGASLFLLCGAAGAVLHARFESPRWAALVWAAGGAVAIAYAAVPDLRWTTFAAFRAAIRPLAMAVSFFVLALVFFAVVCPIALLMRPMRRDPLGLRRGGVSRSYWVERAPCLDLSRYLRQY